MGERLFQDGAVDLGYAVMVRPGRISPLRLGCA